MHARAAADLNASAASAVAFKTKPFVALYVDSPEPSGMGAHMLALADELHARCDFAFVCHDWPGAHELAEQARRRGHEANVLPPSVHAWPVLKSWLSARKPDLFHVHAGIGWEGLTAPGLARQVGVPAVLRTEHLPDLLTDADQRADYAAMLDDLDGRVCVSQASAASHYASPAAPITVVRNGVPTPHRPRKERNALRAELGVEADAPLALTVARMTEQKGHATLLQAAADVVASRLDAVFLWVGDGPLRASLEADAARRGLSEHVRFLGRRDDVADLIAASDLFVLPSLFEGLPLAMLEALQAALPVVATRAPGTAEVFEPDEAAELVPPGDANALARAILRVMNDPDLADELADRGQRLARRHYTARRMGEETYALYRRLLSRAPLRVAPTLQ